MNSTLLERVKTWIAAHEAAGAARDAELAEHGFEVNDWRWNDVLALMPPVREIAEGLVASAAGVERLTAELEEARRAPAGVLAEVAAERARQIDKGYTAEHDDGAVMGELAQVAGLVLLRLNSHEVTLREADEVAGYILGKHSDDRYRQLIIALAMGAAEAERLKRLAMREASTPETDRP